MRKKIEKIFWDMEIIGNRRKMFLALFSEYEVNLSDSTEAISYIMAIVELGKKYANGKFHYHLK